MSWIGGVLVGLVILQSAGSSSADSLWRNTGRGSLFTDVRAGSVGDIVTVVVVESARSDLKAETNAKKDSQNAFTLSNFFGNTHFGAARGGNRGRFDFTGNNEHKGAGNISRADTVTARIPARVMKVLDSGHLLIEGRRAIVVNDETQTLAFTGLVRPNDITPDNTVSSAQVADAEITILGKGILAEKQRPGILQRLFDFLGIF